MTYAIETLEKEVEILKKCLSEWESTEYPEAKKERDKRLKEIIKAIEILKECK